MKILFFLIGCIFSITGAAQSPVSKQFELIGKVNGRDTGSIVLKYTDAIGKWIMDTTCLKEGNFKFAGKISEPTMANIVGKKKIIDFEEVNFVSIFLEPGMQHVELKENNYVRAKFTGSFSQQQMDTLKNQFDSIDAKYKKTFDQLNKAKYEYEDAKTEIEKEKALKKQSDLSPELELRGDEIFHADVAFVLGHPDSYVSPFIFYTPANELPVDSSKAIFKTFTQRIQNSRNGKFITDLLKKREENSISKAAYNFKVEDINGKELILSRFRGKYVLLDFWASWCVPCIKEIPYTKKVYDKYHSKGFEVLTISIDKDTLSWRKAVERQGIKMWYNVLVNDEIAMNYPNVVNPIPSSMLISPEGKIIWKSGGDEGLDVILQKLIR